MVDRNERKSLVLGLLSRGESTTSAELAELWSLSRSGVSTMLAKYHVQGLVSRRREPGPGPPVYRYWITPTGLNKVRWLATQGFLTRSGGQEHLPGLEPAPRVVRPIIHRRGPESGPAPRVVRPIIHRRGPESGRRLVRPEIHHRGDRND